MDTRDIVLISDPRVLAVQIEDNKERLVDCANHPNLKIDERKAKSSSLFSHVREGIVLKLVEAQKFLPDGIRFLLIEGYRPLSLQKEYFEEYSTELSALHADWDAKKIYEEASRYVSPPDIIPPHSTGGAIDLTLVGIDDKELDMGTRVNANPEESNNACYTAAENITAEAKTNRELLVSALSKAGFVNYPTEWWHWSYGDRYWAYSTNYSAAIYGSL